MGVPKTAITKYAIDKGVITEQDEDDAAHGFLNSLMFKGSGYDTEFRPYFMMYGLKPILPKSLFVWMAQNGAHHWLGKLPSGPGVDPAIFFLPRLVSGVAQGLDMRSKYLAWRFTEMLQYSLARKARSKFVGGGAAGTVTPVSRWAQRVLRTRTPDAERAAPRKPMAPPPRTAPERPTAAASV